MDIESWMYERRRIFHLSHFIHAFTLLSHFILCHFRAFTLSHFITCLVLHWSTHVNVWHLKPQFLWNKQAVFNTWNTRYLIFFWIFYDAITKSQFFVSTNNNFNTFHLIHSVYNYISISNYRSAFSIDFQQIKYRIYGPNCGLSRSRRFFAVLYWNYYLCYCYYLIQSITIWQHI